MSFERLRELSRWASIAAITFASTACSPEEQRAIQLTATPPRPIPSPIAPPATREVLPTLTPTETSDLRYPQVVHDFYPGIVGVSLWTEDLPIAEGKLRIINFSLLAHLNSNPISTLYLMFRDIQLGNELDANINGRPVTFRPQKRVEGEVLFIIPPGAPLPSRLKGTPPEASSAFSFFPEEPVIGFLKASLYPEDYPFNPLFIQPEELLSVEAVRAICHAAISVETELPEDEIPLQLFFCDSLTLAITAKQIGFSYGDYDRLASGLKKLTIDETSYDLIPPLDKPVTLGAEVAEALRSFPEAAS